jgi:hypothetical protein
VKWPCVSRLYSLAGVVTTVAHRWVPYRSAHRVERSRDRDEAAVAQPDGDS